MPRSNSAQLFLDYWKNWKWTGGAVKSVANVAIIALMVYFIGPETARRPFTIAVSSGVGVICSFVVFIFLSSLSRKVQLRRLKHFAILLLVTSTLYAILYAVLTGVDLSGDRYVKGFVYTDHVELFIRLSAEHGDPRLTDESLVKQNDNDPRNVWVPSTVDLSAFLVHSAWFIMVFTTTLVLSAVLLLLPKLPEAPSSTPPPPPNQTA